MAYPPVNSSDHANGRDAHPQVFVLLEHGFLAFYLTELLLRPVAHGVGCFRNGWVLLDLGLVVLGVADPP